MAGFDSDSGRHYPQRRMRLGFVGIAVLMATGWGSGFGRAQEQPEQPPASEEAESQELSPFEVARRTPMAEKRTKTESALRAQRDSQARVSTLAREARTDRDILRSNCLQQKLKLIEALLRISEAASTAMYEALAAGKDDVVDQSFAKILVASERSRSVRSEAEACVGAQAVYSGQTQVDVQIDDSIETPDPTASIPPPPTVGSPPVSSSF